MAHRKQRQKLADDFALFRCPDDLRVASINEGIICPKEGAHLIKSAPSVAAFSLFTSRFIDFSCICDACN
jgi:hypothetical protein